MDGTREGLAVVRDRSNTSPQSTLTRRSPSITSCVSPLLSTVAAVAVTKSPGARSRAALDVMERSRSAVGWVGVTVLRETGCYRIGDEREKWGTIARTMAACQVVGRVLGMLARRYWIVLEDGIGRLCFERGVLTRLRSGRGGT